MDIQGDSPESSLEVQVKMEEVVEGKLEVIVPEVIHPTITDQTSQQCHELPLGPNIQGNYPFANINPLTLQWFVYLSNITDPRCSQ